MKIFFSQNKIIMCIFLLLVWAAFTGCASPTTNDYLYYEDELVQEKAEEKSFPGEKEQQKAEREAGEDWTDDKQHKEEKEKEIEKKAGEGGKRINDNLIEKKLDENKCETKSAEKSKAIVTIEGPSDVETIMEAVTVELQEGDTVLDILQRITREEGIQMEHRGRGSTAYVAGIDNYYEFDKGPGSGWMYSVNGYFPNRGSGTWKVEEGDHIEWHYTKDLGRDLGVGLQGGRPEENND